MNYEIKLISKRCKIAIFYDDKTYKADKLIVSLYYFFSVFRQYGKLNTRKTARLPGRPTIYNYGN